MAKPKKIKLNKDIIVESVSGLVNTTWPVEDAASSTRAGTEAQIAAAAAAAAAAGGDTIVSADPNIIVTAEGEAGVADTFPVVNALGASNHVAGFVSGEDKIEIAAAVLTGLNASTTIEAGELDAAKFVTSGPTADTLFYDGGVLSYSKTADGDDLTALLTLDGAPTLAATDIVIV